VTYTPASPDRPVRRKVLINGRPHVVEVYQELVTIRPLRVRRPDAIVAIKWGTIYTDGLLRRPLKRRRKVSRNLLRG